MEATGWSGLFAVAFRQSRNPMTLVDEERRHVDVNGAYLRLTGYKPEDLIGRPIWEFVAGGPLLTQEQWAAALATRPVHRRGGDGVPRRAPDHGPVGRGHRDRHGQALGALRRARQRLAPVHPGAPRGSEREPRPLSKREKEVVRYVALGYTGPEMASELHISHDTVRTHVRNAMEKTGSRSRAQLVAKVLGSGIALG